VIQAFARLAPSILLLAVALRVRAITRSFHQAGATSPATAKPLDELRVRGRGLAFRLLSRRGVLVPLPGGEFYLDPVAEDRWRRRRRTVLPIVLALVLVVVVVLLWRSS
jgi:hypothetical protein